MKLSISTFITAATLGLALLAGACAVPRPVVVQPQEIDSLLVNPGRGFTTFYSFNGDERNRSYPQCTIAYFRWYWDRLEPQEGQYAFGMIDSLLALCRANGQKLAFRVMCQDGHEDADPERDDGVEAPGWFRAEAPGFLYPDRRHWQPDYDSPQFLEKHGRLIRALGERYDGNPDLDHVDIGSVGRWGEWHTSGLNLPMPKRSTEESIIDCYLLSFKKTRLVMNVDEGPALDYAIAHGAGWRADCLGDMRPGWSHMRVAYPALIFDHELDEVWEHAPAVFETCWNFQHWLDEGWDVDSIFTQALAWHISVLNNKSFPIPDAWMPRVRQFEKKMGYRFALRRLEHPDRVWRGESFKLHLNWENLGVAPCYVKYPLAVEFRPLVGGPAQVVITVADIRGWLPGPLEEMLAVAVPQELAPGDYSLGLALVDPAGGKPAIRLAIAGRDSDGWYRLSRVTVK